MSARPPPPTSGPHRFTGGARRFGARRRKKKINRRGYRARKRKNKQLLTLAVSLTDIHEFVQNPFDSSAIAGSNKEMQCVSPPGVPKPTVRWLFQATGASNYTEVANSTRVKVREV